ncbi:MAG: STAS domain-containing protein [Planctomycetota bacterium]|nr:STAS domain-containing protein [Planctomycetota bacterium]
MTSDQELPVAVEQQDEMTVVTPDGEIDLSRAPSFRSVIAEVFNNKPSKVAIDLHNVPYMDSSGVATLVEGMQLANRSEATLVLVGLQERVKSIFEIARLDTVFKIVDELSEAKEL